VRRAPETIQILDDGVSITMIKDPLDLPYPGYDVGEE
jgi:hypothetical protein